MNDFRLLAFITVAQTLSFTKAATLLRLSQPAISKHINELERQYSVQLFERGKGGVVLTSSGERFLELAIEINQKYKELRFEMDLRRGNQSGELNIGASSTIAHYVLPSIISKFISRFPQIKLSLVTGNTQHIETLLHQNKIDIGIAEGLTHKKEFKYTHLAKDELVIITSNCNKVNTLTIDELKTAPLVVRENGSGTLEVISSILKEAGVNYADLNIVIELGSSEAIKRFVMDSNNYAIVSIAAVAEEIKSGKLKTIKVNGVNFNREFAFISQIGKQNRVAEKFIAFATAIGKF